MGNEQSDLGEDEAWNVIGHIPVLSFFYVPPSMPRKKISRKPISVRWDDSVCLLWNMLLLGQWFGRFGNQLNNDQLDASINWVKGCGAPFGTAQVQTAITAGNISQGRVNVPILSSSHESYRINFDVENPTRTNLDRFVENSARNR